MSLGKVYYQLLGEVKSVDEECFYTGLSYGDKILRETKLLLKYAWFDEFYNSTGLYEIIYIDGRYRKTVLFNHCKPSLVFKLLTDKNYLLLSGKYKIVKDNINFWLKNIKIVAPKKYKNMFTLFNLMSGKIDQFVLYEQLLKF